MAKYNITARSVGSNTQYIIDSSNDLEVARELVKKYQEEKSLRNVTLHEEI